VLILGHAALTKRQVKHAVDKLHEEEFVGSVAALLVDDDDP
jgi:hypothetical protein